MKKFLAMLFLGAFLFAGVVGCGDDKDKDKKKDKDAKPAETKKDDKK